MKSLFYNPAQKNKQMNNSFNGGGWGRGRGGGFYKKKSSYGGRNSSSYGERLMNIEKVGREDIGITFQGFFDPNLKDIIKGLSYSRYDADRKMWIMREAHKDDMI